MSKNDKLVGKVIGCWCWVMGWCAVIYFGWPWNMGHGLLAVVRWGVLIVFTLIGPAVGMFGDEP